MRLPLMTHFLSIPMVRSDDQDVTVLRAGLGNEADGMVGGLDGFQGGGVVAGVTDHVGWGEVGEDEGVLAGAYRLAHRLCYLGNGHFRLKVISRNLKVMEKLDLWRRNQNSLFILERLFSSSVEKERHVRVLFSF